MNGKKIKLLVNHPEMEKKVIFCTGIAMVGNVKKFLDKSGRPVLHKYVTA
jgi:hypothetical protein